MTPAEHLALSEQLLAEATAEGAQGNEWTAQQKTRLSFGHALIAMAAETGVPHLGPGGEVSTGDHPQNS